MLDPDYLAMAARAHDVIERTPGGRPPVLAQAGERWSPVPAHLAAMPLADSSGTVGGVVAFWGAAAPEPSASDLIRALAPLLADKLSF